MFLEKHGLAHLVERFEEDGLSSVTDLFAAIQLRDIDFAKHYNITRGHLQKLTRVLEEEAAKITARGPVPYRCKKVMYRFAMFELREFWISVKDPYGLSKESLGPVGTCLLSPGPFRTVPTFEHNSTQCVRVSAAVGSRGCGEV